MERTCKLYTISPGFRFIMIVSIAYFCTEAVEKTQDFPFKTSCHVTALDKQFFFCILQQ